MTKTWYGRLFVVLTAPVWGTVFVIGGLIFLILWGILGRIEGAIRWIKTGIYDRRWFLEIPMDK